MQAFQYINDQFHVEDLPLNKVAKEFGTPCYVYSKAELLYNWQQFSSSFKSHPHQICYAVKANPSLAILNLFAQFGSGFDVVSQGELERVIAAGGQAAKTIFSGVGKTSDEISFALDMKVQCLNIESTSELSRINQIASEKKIIAPIALRVNPDINAKTHPYITTGFRNNKFGIAWDKILELVTTINKLSNVRLIGIACHIGSQMTELGPILAATDKLISLLDKIKQPIEWLDLGGGLGICYKDETPPSIKEYGEQLCKKLRGRSEKLILEPGRALVANSGILLARVEYIKQTTHKNFLIVDAGMNDLPRPALYDAWHEILPVNLSNKEKTTYDIVGPICESTDCLGRERSLAISEGEQIAILTSGAYAASMGSNYNARPKPPEILVDKTTTHLIRKKEKLSELFRHETTVGH